MSDITHLSSSEELADPGGVSRERVLERLQDWQRRVHQLYAQVEQAFRGTPFGIDRQGKHTSNEELPQRVGLTEEQQPKIDVLRVVRPDGTNAAIFFPRGLWVIGANGWIDLRIVRPVGGSESYLLQDQSEPFSGPAQWVRIPIGSPFEREPFDPSWLVSRLR
jgi:hypothetical protein